MYIYMYICICVCVCVCVCIREREGETQRERERGCGFKRDAIFTIMKRDKAKKHIEQYHDYIRNKKMNGLNIP